MSERPSAESRRRPTSRFRIGRAAAFIPALFAPTPGMNPAARPAFIVVQRQPLFRGGRTFAQWRKARNSVKFQGLKCAPDRAPNGDVAQPRRRDGGRQGPSLARPHSSSVWRPSAPTVSCPLAMAPPCVRGGSRRGDRRRERVVMEWPWVKLWRMLAQRRGRPGRARPVRPTTASVARRVLRRRLRQRQAARAALEGAGMGAGRCVRAGARQRRPGRAGRRRDPVRGRGGRRHGGRGGRRQPAQRLGRFLLPRRPLAARRARPCSISTRTRRFPGWRISTSV